MKKSLFLSITLFFLMFFSSAAQAHPAYSGTKRTIETESREKITFIRWYGDGILSIDPAKLLVQRVGERGEEIIFETDYGREVAVFCQNKEKCFIFLYNNDILSVFPREIYQLEIKENIKATELKNIEIDTWLKFCGIVMPFIENPPGYLLHIACLFLAIMLFFFGRRQIIQKQYTGAGFRFFYGALALLLWIAAIIWGRFFLPLLLALTLIAALLFAAALYCLYRQKKIDSFLGAAEGIVCFLGGLLALSMLLAFIGLIISVLMKMTMGTRPNMPLLFAVTGIPAIILYCLYQYKKKKKNAENSAPLSDQPPA